MKKLIIIFASALPFMAYAQQTEQADSLARELQEIVVTAKQPATKLVGTTLVSTIPGTNLQDIGSALDVLAQLPMIQVTDNTVSIIGKGSPEIYIDDRPMRSDDELIQLQSDNIRKVELLMAPGAMYSSGTKAVLRISTRHNFIDGLSLLERAEGIARRKISANNSLDLSYRLGKWDFFLFSGIHRNNLVIKGKTTNTLVYDGEPTVVGSSQYNASPATAAGIKPGYNFSSRSISFGAYYNYNPENGDFTNKGTEWIDSSNPVNRIITRDIHAHSHLVSLYYHHNLSNESILHFDGNYKNSYAANDVRTSYPDGNLNDVNSADTRRSTLWAGKLYLSFPLAQGSFTAGTQDSYTRTTLDYQMFNPDISEYIPSSVSEAKQTAAAAFATWSRQFGNISLSAGLRYEYVDYIYSINGKRDKDMSRRDHLLTPDISLDYWFNQESQLSLSYKMATVKPPYSRLTGSLSYVGMHEIEGGNPALKDEHMHDLQLFGMWKGFMLQADYTRSLDTYAFVKCIYPASNLQLLMQPINIDVSAASIYLVWSRPIKTWTPNITIGTYKQWLDINGTHYNHPTFSYYFTNTISLPKDFLITLNASGRSKGDMHTNRFNATWFALDASVSKSFFNKALQLKLEATDIFNTLDNDWTMVTYGIVVNKQQTYDHRGISLSLTYKFHPRKSKYKGEDASRSEMNRL